MRELHVTRDGQLQTIYLDDRSFQVRDALDVRQVLAEIRDKNDRFYQRLAPLPGIRRINEGAVKPNELATAVDLINSEWVRQRAGI
jgi:hypothetical protein